MSNNRAIKAIFTRKSSYMYCFKSHKKR